MISWAVNDPKRTWAWSAYDVGLVQASAAEAIQIMRPVSVILDWHLVREPAERNIWLRAAKLLQRDPGDISMAGHAGGGGQHPVGADEIAALPDALAKGASPRRSCAR